MTTIPRRLSLKSFFHRSELMCLKGGIAEKSENEDRPCELLTYNLSASARLSMSNFGIALNAVIKV